MYKGRSVTYSYILSYYCVLVKICELGIVKHAIYSVICKCGDTIFVNVRGCELYADSLC